MKPLLLLLILLSCKKSETVTTNIAKITMKNKRPAARVNEYQNGGNEFKLFVQAGNSDIVHSLQLCNLGCIRAVSLCDTSILIKPNLVLNCRLIDLKKDQPITIIFIHAGNFLLSESTKKRRSEFRQTNFAIKIADKKAHLYFSTNSDS